MEDFSCQGLDLVNVVGCVTATTSDEDLEFDYFLEAAKGHQVFYCRLSRDELSTTEGTRGRTTYQRQANLA